MTSQDMRQDIEMVKQLADECQATAAQFEFDALTDPTGSDFAQLALEQRQLAAVFRLVARLAEDKLHYE